MDNIASYVSGRISDLEKLLENSDPADRRFAILKAKYDAFVEIEEYLAGNLEEEDYEITF